MTTYFRRATIIKIKKLKDNDINEDLRWFSTSIGMSSVRDKEKSCFRIFIELLKALKAEEKLSSDKIAEKTNLSRGTVIHHINRLLERDIVNIEDNKYNLKYKNLSGLVDHLESNVLTAFKDIKEIAKKIDENLELEK
ncbi:hypothetical protein CL621_02040 [archaeon]|nr:hypothetical protein [archaeon]|tara:strand:- start:2714 stop:3127 length:414 start_codon:yes stop_codon:yes gene_type:complete